MTLNHGSRTVGSDKTNNRGRYKIFFRPSAAGGFRRRGTEEGC